MARFDRTFLVPYLNDICALHLSKRKINNLINVSMKEIEHIQKDAIDRVQHPVMEEHKQLSFGHGCGTISWALIGIVLFFASLFSAADGIGGLIFFLLFTYGGIGFAIYLFVSGRKENKRIDKRNEERNKDYVAAQKTALDEAEPLVDGIRKRIDFYREEISVIEGLLQELYSANVIPGWYRDLYPAVYLNDWFSNSRSDDLDMALNTLVLEQIKEKLDVIIHNQSESLVNQRIMIANQNRMIDQGERHHRELMQRLDEIEATGEEQNTYLRMINANTATDAFFAKATYLRW